MKNPCVNSIQIKLLSLSVNEGMARAACAAFCSQLDPTATELADVKCAVSEAVTNCIVHAYRDKLGIITLNVYLYADGNVKIRVKDNGCGIPDISQARQPMFTTDAGGERSGMGFTVMETFTDKLRVTSKVGRGTTVTMWKQLSGKKIT